MGIKMIVPGSRTTKARTATIERTGAVPFSKSKLTRTTTTAAKKGTQERNATVATKKPAVKAETAPKLEPPLTEAVEKTTAATTATEKAVEETTKATTTTETQNKKTRRRVR